MAGESPGHTQQPGQALAGALRRVPRPPPLSPFRRLGCDAAGDRHALRLGATIARGGAKVFGRLPPAEDNQAEADFPRDCSGLVNFACRAGGRVPRPDLPDEEVEPGHFSAASFARYLCTLYWSQEEVDATRSMS